MKELMIAVFAALVIYFLGGGGIVSLILFGIALALCKKYDQKKAIEEARPVPRNLPLQYIYTIDEWYKLRCEFDQLIDAQWEKYRKGEITKEEYRDSCKLVEKQIIGDEYNQDFETLYQFGVRNAAIRMVKMGYAPGMTKSLHYTKKDLAGWEPDCFPIWPSHPKDDWIKCVPGEPKPRTFLTMYPNPGQLEFIGCGIYEDGVWYPELDEDAPVGKYYKPDDYLGKGDKNERMKAVSLLQSRGYNGKEYALEPKRDFGDLTQEEIDKKYFYVTSRFYPENEEQWSAVSSYYTNYRRRRSKAIE